MLEVPVCFPSLMPVMWFGFLGPPMEPVLLTNFSPERWVKTIFFGTNVFTICCSLVVKYCQFSLAVRNEHVVRNPCLIAAISHFNCLIRFVVHKYGMGGLFTHLSSELHLGCHWVMITNTWSDLYIFYEVRWGCKNEVQDIWTPRWLLDHLCEEHAIHHIQGHLVDLCTILSGWPHLIIFPIYAR